MVALQQPASPLMTIVSSCMVPLVSICYRVSLFNCPSVFPSHGTATIMCGVMCHEVSYLLQVEKVIAEAVSPDNLCELYEGWTPWV